MKYITAASLLIAFSNVSYAFEIGAGASLNSNDSSVYLPIEINDSFRIEPVLRHHKTTHKGESSREEYLSTDLLLGFFGKSSVMESVTSYYGGRLGFISNQQRRKSDGYSYEEDSTGYIVQPAFGFEYNFNEKISLGGEVSYFYTSEEVDYAQGSGDSELDRKANGTHTAIILRYVF